MRLLFACCLLAFAPALRAQTTLPAAVQGVWQAGGRDAVHIAFSAQSATVYDWMGDTVNLLGDCYAVTTYPSVVETSPGIYGLQSTDGSFVFTSLRVRGDTLRTTLQRAEGSDLTFRRTLLSEAAFVPRCAAADLERPGFGASTAAPLGMAWHLPPGVSLDGPITAANADGSCSGGRNTLPPVGSGLVCLCVPIRNDTDSTVTLDEADFPPALVITSASEGFQHGLFVEHLVVPVPPTSRHPLGRLPELVLCGACANKHRDPPEASLAYGAPLASTDRAAQHLAGLVRGGVLGLDAGPLLQEAVWSVTDGEGLSAAARAGLLGALQPDTDGDGAGDRDEGTADADGDGTPDFADADVTRFVAPLAAFESRSFMPPRLGVFVALSAEKDGVLEITRLPATAVAPGAALPWAYRLGTGAAPAAVDLVCVTLSDRPPSLPAETLGLYHRPGGSAPWQRLASWLSPSSADPDLICAGEGVDALGTFVVATATPTAAGAAPEVASPLTLHAPFPNPVGALVQAEVVLARPALLLVADVLDALGRRVARVYEGAAAGPIALHFDTSALPSGLYLLHVQADAHQARQAFVVAR